MRHVILVTALLAASYVLWVLSSSSELADPPPPPVVAGTEGVNRAMEGEEGAPPVLNRPQKRASSGPVGRLSSDLTPPSAQLVEAQEGLALENPSKETSPIEPPHKVEQSSIWAPSRKLEHLRAYGLLGLYTGWLAEAERIGWSASRDALSVSREGVLIHFTSKDGMLQGAEVNLPPLALSDSVMDLWRALLGDEEEHLNLQPPFEREEQGWSEQRSVALPSGRSVELTLRGRSSGEPPYGPERVTLTISALRR